MKRVRRIKVVLTVNYYEGMELSDLEESLRLLNVPALIAKVEPDYHSTQVLCNDCGAWLPISPRGIADHTYHHPECKLWVEREVSDDEAV